MVDTEWGTWSNRILGLLEVSQSQLLRGYTLPRPWFLVPRQGELTEKEAEDLFAAVRERMLGLNPSNPSVAVVRRRVERIKAGESLPLLYAMRHVARFRGRTGNYWPAFLEDVLADRLRLHEVQVGLAGSLADVWIRTHEYTQGALYCPREGAARIKWPLAHAGLLKTDEVLLESFGIFLAEESGDELAAAPLGPEDLDEFLTSSLRWLRQGGHWHDVRLARLLRQTDGTQRTVAELSQRWLQDNWARVVNARWHRRSHASRAHTPRLHATTVRTYLRYDAAENRLFAVLPARVWPGRAEAKVLWGDQEIAVPPRYVRVEDETRFGAVNLPVGETVPEGGSWLVIGGERRTLRVPSLPQDRGVVFEMADGRATNRWRAGEAYHVLLAKGEIDGEAADELFDEWAVVGPPEGIEGREVLSGRTKDPLLDGGAAVDISLLELAADTLGLPGLEDLWRPRVRMVGGTPMVGERGEVFSRDDLPLVEVRGLWEGALPVRLTRWDAGRDEYTHEAELRLSVPESVEPRLVDISVQGYRVSAGEYRIEVGSLFRAFFEVGTLPATPEPGRFKVTLGARAEDGSSCGERLTRHELEYATLVGRAWAGAELTLRVSTGGAWSRALSAQADEGGEWRARWRDLGLGNLPGGPLELSLSWRGLAEDRITAADAPYIAVESLELRWQGHGSGRSLSVSALVSGADRDRRAEVVLVGLRPWDNQLWTQTVALGEGRNLRTHVRVGDGKAEWLLVLPEPDSGDVAEPPWLIHRLPKEPTRDPRLQFGQYSTASRGRQHARWNGIVSRLRGASLPVDLGRVLDISTLADYALNAPSLRPGLPKWSEAEGPGDLESLLSGGAASRGEVSVAVFYRVQPGLAGYTDSLNPPYMVANAETLARASQSYGGTVDLFCAEPGGSLRKLPSSLEVAETEAGGAFVLWACEELRACPDCGVILPPGEHWNHESPCKAVPCYLHLKKRFIQILEGKSLPVYLLVRRDPGDVLERVQDLLRAVAAGNDSDIPQHAHPWLDELQRLYDDEGTEQEPTDWLLGLVPLPQRIEVVRQRIERGGNEEESRLVELGRQVRRYRPALDVLYRWLRSETG